MTIKIKNYSQIKKNFQELINNHIELSIRFELFMIISIENTDAVV